MVRVGYTNGSCAGEKAAGPRGCGNFGCVEVGEPFRANGEGGLQSAPGGICKDWERRSNAVDVREEPYGQRDGD